MTAPTLILERLMMHPRYPELVNEIRRSTPGPAVDQADAAVAGALDLTESIARCLDRGELGWQTPAGLPGWLRLSLLDAFAGYLTGRADTCRHNPCADLPQPVLAAAWKPGLVACRSCAHLFAVGRGTVADRTCDGCGRVCGGAGDGDGIHPCAVQLGPMVFQYGVCADCHDPLTASAIDLPDRS